MSASSCVWIGSFFSVALMIEPTSSRSGKKISSRSTAFSCAIEITRGVSSSFASRITSPVAGSTTSAAANAPSSSASEISTASTFARLRASTAFFVIFLPDCTVKCSPGTTMSLAARRPTRLSATAHLIWPSFSSTRSTLWKVRMISSAPRSPRARRNTEARNFRLRSIRTYSRFFVSYSNSTQEPRYGMICAT